VRYNGALSNTWTLAEGATGFFFQRLGGTAGDGSGEAGAS